MALGLRPHGLLRNSRSQAGLGCDASSASRNRGYLARAGWSVLSTGSLPPIEPAVDMEALGRRIVGDVALCWSGSYQHTIRPLGLHDGCFHYECIFSLPTQGKPVPNKVLHTKFALLAPLDKDRSLRPRLFYSFEESDLRHEWRLERGPTGQWQATKAQQVVSLGRHAFEGFINRMVGEKQTAVRKYVDNLNTNFEAMRMKPPPAYNDEDFEGAIIWAEEEGGVLREELKDYHIKVNSNGSAESPEDAQSAEEMAAMKTALKASGLACELVAPPTSMQELLENIFDAADEDRQGELPHYEVARLLGSLLPGFGLEEWDIHKLLASAKENMDGMIELQPFIEAAPDIVHGMRARRIAFQARNLPEPEITMEAVKYCFEDEIEETIVALMKVFEASWLEDDDRGKHTTTSHQVINARKMEQHKTENVMETQLPVIRGTDEDYTLVAFKRCYARECIEAVPERLSPQQMERLMQFLPEDEDGFVHIDTFNDQLEMLHQQALLHAIVETDLKALWVHLVQCFRRVGISEEGKMKLWLLKDALLQADQLCMSRLQVHVLLCLASPDAEGQVDVAQFLGICCQVIQHMFNSKIFADTAERLQLEHAEQSRKAENAELAAFAASTVIQTNNEEEKMADHEVDQETVEKNLIQALSLSDDTHRNPPVLTPEPIFGVLAGGNDIQVQACQLSEKELVGLMAEMPIDSDGQVLYVEYVKRWVPHIFELRKNQLLSAYLHETALEVLEVPPTDIQELQKHLPVLEAKRSTSVNRRTASKQAAPAEPPPDSEATVKRMHPPVQLVAGGDSRSPSKDRRHVHVDGISVDDEEDYEEGGTNSRSVSGLPSFRGTAGLRKSMVERTRRIEIAGPQVAENPHGRGHGRREAKIAEAEEARKKEAEAPQVVEKPAKAEEKAPRKVARSRTQVDRSEKADAKDT